MGIKQATNMEVKKNNRNRVFRYICKHGTVSNPDISYSMKMSLPTVTQITKELIEKGFIAGNIWNRMGVLLLGFYRIVIGKKSK